MFKLATPARCARNSGVVLGALTLALASHAGPVSYTGIFQFDNDVVSTLPLVNFGATGGTLSAHTFSWAQGGFVPLLMLFDSSGQVLQTATAGGVNHDVGFNISLSMGSYLLVLAQDGNLPNTGLLADGFTYTDGALTDPNYTLVNALPLSPPGQFFSFFDGNSRTSAWGLNVEATNNPGTTVPEPTSLALVVAALGASAALRRRLTA